VEDFRSACAPPRASLCALEGLPLNDGSGVAAGAPNRNDHPAQKKGLHKTAQERGSTNTKADSLVSTAKPPLECASRVRRFAPRVRISGISPLMGARPIFTAWAPLTDRVLAVGLRAGAFLQRSSWRLLTPAVGPSESWQAWSTRLRTDARRMAGSAERRCVLCDARAPGHISVLAVCRPENLVSLVQNYLPGPTPPIRHRASRRPWHRRSDDGVRARGHDPPRASARGTRPAVRRHARRIDGLLRARAPPFPRGERDGARLRRWSSRRGERRTRSTAAIRLVPLADNGVRLDRTTNRVWRAQPEIIGAGRPPTRKVCTLPSGELATVNGSQSIQAIHCAFTSACAGVTPGSHLSLRVSELLLRRGVANPAGKQTDEIDI